MPTDEMLRHSRIIRRRPMVSAHGASSSDPAAMPNRPADSSRPSAEPDSAHSLETDWPVNAITSTSNPSSTLRATQIATANH